MSARTAAAFFIVLAGTTALASCSLLAPGPPRDADGRVTEPTVAGAQYLEVGDCFSFADGSQVEITPCTQPHSYVVIGQGTIPQADVDAAGGAQNAVSAACDEAFSSFKEEAAAAGRPRPDQELIVASREVDGKPVTAYSCVATDAAGDS